MSIVRGTRIQNKTLWITRVQNDGVWNETVEEQNVNSTVIFKSIYGIPFMYYYFTVSPKLEQIQN